MIEMEDNCKGNEFLITKYFFELWDIIMRRFTEAYRVHVHNMEESSGHNSRLKEMMLFIDERYRDRISLNDIARAGGVSQSLCNQIFNKLTEKSPIEYLAQYRCRKVADLLASSEMSMTEIADAATWPKLLRSISTNRQETTKKANGGNEYDSDFWNEQVIRLQGGPAFF